MKENVTITVTYGPNKAKKQVKANYFRKKIEDVKNKSITIEDLNNGKRAVFLVGNQWENVRNKNGIGLNIMYVT